MKVQLVLLAVVALAAADKKPESTEDSSRQTRDNFGIGYGAPAPSYGAPIGGGGYGGGGLGSGLGGGLGGGYGAPAPAPIGGGYGGGGGAGYGGGNIAGWSSSGSGHYTSKPAVIHIPLRIPIPVPIPKHSHHHHYHKHVRVTPVNHVHKHVKVYPLYQQHRHVKVVPHVTKVIKVQKPILVKPIVTPVYRPVVHEYKTVEQKSYDGGSYQGKVSHSHVDGGSFSGGSYRQDVDDGVRHINKGVIRSGAYGVPQVQTLPAVVNQAYSAGPAYAAPAPAPLGGGYGGPGPELDGGYGAPAASSGGYGGGPALGGGYGRSDNSDESGAVSTAQDGGNAGGYGH